MNRNQPVWMAIRALGVISRIKAMAALSIVLTMGCSTTPTEKEQPPKGETTRATTLTKQSKDAPPPRIEIKDVEPSWNLDKSQSIWLPRVRFTVMNYGQTDIDNLVIKGIFIDSKGIVAGQEVIQSVGPIPSQSGNGPVFIRGTIGYTHTNTILSPAGMVFLNMIDHKTKLWTYRLYIQNTNDSTKTVIANGEIRPPRDW